MKYRILILMLVVFSGCAGDSIPLNPDNGSGLFSRPNNLTCLAGPVQTPASNLADTGCVDPADPTQGAGGLIPYELNFPFWSDGAIKHRWMALPDGQTVSIDENGDWHFPIGTVLVKVFSVNDQVIETRLFKHHEDGNWAGYSYEWNEAGTEASLVPSGGKIRILNNGQSWQYPGRSQCLICHNANAGNTLGPENAQLNRLFTYPSTGITANQITTLAAIGVLSEDPGDPEQLPSYFPWDGTQPNPGELAAAARAYLHTNCSICHRPGGPGGGPEDFRFNTPLAQMNACDVAPTLDDYGIIDPLLIAPGDPARSIVSFRIGTDGQGRMPPLASFLVDAAGSQLVNDWIASLGSCD